MGYRIGKGLGIITNPNTNNQDLVLINGDAMASIATFTDKEDATEFFKRIVELQGITAEETELLKLYQGTSETMRTSIKKILEVTQVGKKESEGD